MNLSGFLDYNSTSPLSNSVKEFIKGEDFFFNASAPYFSAKKSLSLINKTKVFLYECFNLEESEFDIVFHSGATEAVNLIIKGYALKFRSESKKIYLSQTDHPCALGQAPFIKEFGHQISWLKTNKQFANIEVMPKDADFIHLTWVNNESGVINPLSLLDSCFDKTLVYIDGAQALGKIENPFKLHPRGDIYSFSAHKFGGLKGAGWSFVRKNTNILKIIDGGNQSSLRSGTLNTLGIYSIYLALNDVLNDKEKIAKCEGIRNYIEDQIQRDFLKIKILNNTERRNCNTILLTHEKVNSDILIGAFDLAGIQVSAGSACSSGSNTGNNWVKHVYGSELAIKTIRISLNPKIHFENKEALYQRIKKVFSRFD